MLSSMATRVTYPYPPLDLDALQRSTRYRVPCTYRRRFGELPAKRPTTPGFGGPRIFGGELLKVPGPRHWTFPYWNPLVLHTLGRAYLIDTTGDVDAGPKA